MKGNEPFFIVVVAIVIGSFWKKHAIATVSNQGTSSKHNVLTDLAFDLEGLEFFLIREYSIMTWKDQIERI